MPIFWPIEWPVSLPSVGGPSSSLKPTLSSNEKMPSLSQRNSNRQNFRLPKSLLGGGIGAVEIATSPTSSHSGSRRAGTRGFPGLLANQRRRRRAHQQIGLVSTAR